MGQKNVKQGVRGNDLRLHLRLVQSGSNDVPVGEVDLVLADILLERDRVLHPAIVISVGEVLSRVGSTTLLPGLGRNHGHVGRSQQVAQLKSLDEVTG